MNVFEKIKFLLKKPKVVIVVVKNNQELVKKAISQVLGHSLRLQREVLITDNYRITDLSKGGYLILNYDNGDIQKFKDGNPAKLLTFGFQEGADFRATDVKLNAGTNFKISYRGNVVPIWLASQNQEDVYSALAATAVGTIFDLNLVEISQILSSS